MNKYTKLTAEEAALLIKNNDNVAFSGFTPAGAPKVVPKAIAARAKELHAAGTPFKIGVFTGASTGPSLDGALAQADAIRFRAPYQSNSDLRKAINEGRAPFSDMHLSVMPQYIRYGFLGPVDVAVIEAADITPDGEIVITSGVGCSSTYCHMAKKIIIELNKFHPASLRGIHDIYEPLDPPNRLPIPLTHVNDHIGTTTIKVDPKKIVGIVDTDVPDEIKGFGAATPITDKIGANVADFLTHEMKRGLIPPGFLPLQSGVGDTANAVLKAMGASKEIPVFSVYTEVIQDAVIGLMKASRVNFASGCSLTVSNGVLKDIYANMDFFRPKIVLRPQEISNSPEVIRRLGLISINTAIEADITGNVNSTHVLGRSIMNGIGGSGDFARNAYLTIFTCPSVAKGGKISTIVPMVSHQDHSEHSVQIIITEQGVADLRGKDPEQRAHEIIEKCANPEYRPFLRDYIAMAGHAHTPQTLSCAFGMHLAFAKKGDMRLVNWADFK